jgi:hypothetical protein
VFQVEEIHLLNLVESDEALGIHLLSSTGIIQQLAELGIQRFLLDTGAQTHLGFASLGPYMINKVKSMIRLRGAFGNKLVDGIHRGELPLFVLGTDDFDTVCAGSSRVSNVTTNLFTRFKPTIDTVAGLNAQLLSYDKLYLENYDLHLQRHGWSGLINDEIGHWLPAYRDPNTGMWYLFFFMGTAADAKQVAVKAQPLFRQLLQDQISANHVSIDDLCELPWHLPDPIPEDEDEAYVTFVEHYDINYFTSAELEQFAREEEHVCPGYKGQLGPEFKKLTRKHIHDRFGCIGFDPSCRTCQAVKKTNVRKFPEKEPPRSTQPGRDFYLDMIKWNYPDDEGCTNSYVMRDDCSGYYDALVLQVKSDFAKFIPKVINKIRDKYQHRWHDHIVYAELHCDGAGELSSAALETALKDDVQGPAVQLKDYDPMRVKTHAKMEAAVKDVELGTKRLMLALSLPADKWRWCQKSFIWLRRRFPRQRDVVSADGDTITPLERISRGEYSRQQCRRDLRSYVRPGTVVRVTNARIIGSSITDAAREKYAVAWKMKGDMPYFKLAKCGSWCHTKDYIVVNLPPGVNYMEFFNMKQTVPKVMLELPNTGNSTLERAAKIEAELQLLHTQPEFFIKRDVYMRWIEDGKDFGVYHGVVKNVDNDKLGGAQLWGILWDDNKTTDFTITDMQKFCVQHIDGSKIAPPVLNNTSKMHSNQGESSSKATSSTEPNATVPDSNADDDTDIEPATVEAVRKRLDNLGVEYFKPKKSMSFTEICKACSIPHAQRHLYYEWLAQEHGYGAIPPAQDKDLPWFQFENPIENKLGRCFSVRSVWPYPSGGSWDKLVRKVQDTTQVEIKLVIDMMHEVHYNQVFEAHMATARDNVERSQWKDHDIDQSVIDDCLKPENMQSWLKLPAPATPAEAFKRPDAELWKQAINKELESFNRLRVMSHGHTRASVRERGIMQRPVPLKFVLKCKVTPDNTYDKHRARLVLCGHRGYCIEGVHYKDTFSASPDIETSRLVQAVALVMGWVRLCFDISVAYLHSDADRCQQIPLIYPPGYEMTGADGQPLFGILLKSVYGHPAASKNWSDTRDAWIKRHFNANGWSAVRSQVDLALWILRSPEQHLILCVIYTDDVDCVGANMGDLEYVKQAFHEQYGVTHGNPAFMLGVKREITTLDDGTRVLEYSMPQFIEDTYDTFRHDMRGITLEDTPLPPDTLIGPQQADHNPDEAEQARYRKKGYLSLVGSLLWACRQAHPEIAGALAMLCSVMASPSARAYSFALRTLHWLYHHRHEGLCYRSDGNIEPIMYYDSSNNQFADGRALYMYELMFAGGPIAYVARKHERVRDSTAYSEYSAQNQAGQRCDWIRNIITEIGAPLLPIIDRPILLLGDNDVATKTALGTVSSAKTKHWDLYEHMNKQRYELGVTLPDRVPSPDNNTDCGTKSQKTADFLRLYRRLKGYSESYIPPNYNLKHGPMGNAAD